MAIQSMEIMRHNVRVILFTAILIVEIVRTERHLQTAWRRRETRRSEYHRCPINESRLARMPATMGHVNNES